MKKQPLIFAGELIGKEVVIESSTNISLVGLAGTIIDETRNMLVLNTFGKRKTVLKSSVTLDVTLENGQIQLIGSTLQKRPEARIKQ
jgi:ribonuclease P protein subunit POP4